MHENVLDQPTRTSRGELLRFSCLAAPVAMVGYGLVRLIDGLDGQHGPGLAWTAGHTLFLAAMLLFGLATALVRQLVPTTTIGRRVVADFGTAAAAVGLACFLKVIVIDLVVGLRAADRTAMGELFARYQDDPVALPAVLDDFGPALFIVGVAVLLTQLAMLHPRRLPGWSPAVFLAGALLIEVNLDLLPLGAILLGVALLPLTRRPDPALAARPAPTTGRWRQLP